MNFINFLVSFFRTKYLNTSNFYTTPVYFNTTHLHLTYTDFKSYTIQFVSIPLNPKSQTVLEVLILTRTVPNCFNTPTPKISSYPKTSYINQTIPKLFQYTRNPKISTNFHSTYIISNSLKFT